MTALGHDRLAEIAQEAIEAFVRKDQEAVQRICAPVFMEGDPEDHYLWTMGLVALVMSHVTPLPPSDDPMESMAVPYVARIGDDGTMGPPLPPDAAPPGIATYTRICAAYVNRDVDLIVDLWTALYTGPEASRNVPQCMAMALTGAGHFVRAQRAERN